MPAEGEKSGRTAIAVAVIGVIGVLGAALIQRIPTLPYPASRPQQQRPQQTGTPPKQLPAPSNQQSQQGLTIIHEQNVNRPDATWDLEVLNVGTQDYHACDAPCLSRPDCKSYVYIKPGVRGPAANCVLKSELPIASLYQSCCVSGVVKERALVPGP